MARERSPMRTVRSTVSFAKLAGSIEDLTAAQRAMLLTLSSFGKPVTVSMLVKATGLHPNSVRDSLAVLHSSGLVERRPISNGKRGRPAWEYEPVVPPSLTAIMEEFSSFAASIADYLHEAFDDPQAEAAKIGRIWGRRVFGSLSDARGIRFLDKSVSGEGRTVRADQLKRASRVVKAARRESAQECSRADSGRSSEESALAKAEALAVQLRFLFSVFGFGARPVADDGRIGVCLTACPFGADKNAPDRLVCAMHGAMTERIVEEALGEGVKIDIGVRYPKMPCTIEILLPMTAKDE